MQTLSDVAPVLAVIAFVSQMLTMIPGTPLQVLAVARSERAEGVSLRSHALIANSHFWWLLYGLSLMNATIWSLQVMGLVASIAIVAIVLKKRSMF